MTMAHGRLATAVRPAYLASMSETEHKSAEQPAKQPPAATPVPQPKEIGGPKGPEPTRYGDWEVNGRCTDF